MMNTKLFKLCFFITVVGAIILRWVDQVEPGIIPFELAKTLDNANAMVAQWALQDAIPQKKFSLYFDYIFIFGYAGSLFLILKEWYDKSDKKILLYLSFLPIVAGVLDGIENLGLLKIIYYQGTQFYASLAFYCASVKFLLLLPSILLALYYLYKKFMNR
ncbi:MAG: hypothetical protein KDC82_07010 [Bacteroidetes bacterium]|nr:hypothetical protein [Bacteroidota bacterium]